MRFCRSSEQTNAWASSKINHLLRSEVCGWVSENPPRCWIMHHPLWKGLNHRGCAWLPCARFFRTAILLMEVGHRQATCTVSDDLKVELVTAFTFKLKNVGANDFKQTWRFMQRGNCRTWRPLGLNAISDAPAKSIMAHCGALRELRSRCKLAVDACPEAQWILSIWLLISSSCRPFGGSAENRLRDSAIMAGTSALACCWTWLQA